MARLGYRETTGLEALPAGTPAGALAWIANHSGEFRELVRQAAAAAPADTRLVLHGHEREPAEFEGRRSLPLLWARLRLEMREGELDHAAIELLTALGAWVRAEAQVAEALAAVGAKPAAIDQAGWERMRQTHRAAIAEERRLRSDSPARFTWCGDCHTHTLAVEWIRDRWHCGRCGSEK